MGQQVSVYRDGAKYPQMWFIAETAKGKISGANKKQLQTFFCQKEDVIIDTVYVIYI